ncbi:hypothetical protein HYT52_02315, partial [Candidatus Woesearchaeota archaeon]|nr:hypothetical protein [Candidatus Woesearchaeota archaeon]
MKINLLFLLVVVIMVGCSQSSNIPNSPPFENETEYSSYDLLKSEIESMLQREGISPDIYDQIEMKIRVLESEGIDTKELDQLLAQLSVGGRKENITRLETTKTTYDLLKSDLESLVEAEGIHPQLYEDLQKKVDQLAAQGVNTDELRLLLARLPVGGKEEIKTQPIQQTGPTIWHNMEEGTWEPRG